MPQNVGEGTALLGVAAGRGSGWAALKMGKLYLGPEASMVGRAAGIAEDKMKAKYWIKQALDEN